MCTAVAALGTQNFLGQNVCYSCHQKERRKKRERETFARYLYLSKLFYSGLLVDPLRNEIAERGAKHHERKTTTPNSGTTTKITNELNSEPHSNAHPIYLLTETCTKIENRTQHRAPHPQIMNMYFHSVIRLLIRFPPSCGRIPFLLVSFGMLEDSLSTNENFSDGSIRSVERCPTLSGASLQFFGVGPLRSVDVRLIVRSL